MPATTGSGESRSEIDRSASASTVVVAPAESLPLLGSKVAEVTEAVDEIVDPSTALEGTYTVSVKTGTAPAPIDGLVHVTTPDPPNGGVVQLQPIGGTKAAKVVPEGTGSEKLPDSASLGPAFVTVAASVSCVPASTGSGVSTSETDRSASELTVVVAPAESLPGVGSGVAAVTFTELPSVDPPADGDTSRFTVKTADVEGAIAGAVQVIGPLPPGGGVEQDQPPEGAIDTKAVAAGMTWVKESPVAALGPALEMVMV